MLDFSFTGPGGDLLKSFDLMVKRLETTQGDLDKAGSYLVGRIRESTLSGVDYAGDPFAIYSPAYATRKRNSAVTLFGSGSGPHMLDALTSRTTGPSSFEVGVFGDERIATRARAINEGAEIPTRAGTGPEGFRTHPGRRPPKGKKTYAVIPARRWLYPSDTDLTRMEEIIAESMLERINQK